MAGQLIKNVQCCKTTISRNPGNQKRTECASPSIPQSACNRWKNKADNDGDELDLAMLPANKSCLSVDRERCRRRIAVELKDEPADVRIKEAFRYTVGVVIVIDMLVVAAMFARPHER